MSFIEKSCVGGEKSFWPLHRIAPSGSMSEGITQAGTRTLRARKKFAPAFSQSTPNKKRHPSSHKSGGNLSEHRGILLAQARAKSGMTVT